MLRLLQIEWLKLSRNKSFRVFFVLYMIGLPLLFPIGLQMDFPREFSIKKIYAFPDVWAFLGYLGSWLTFFCFGLLSVTLIAQEYQFKTLRQQVINGLSRKEFLLSKLLLCAFVSLLATLYYVLVGFGYGYTYTDFLFFSKVTEQMWLIPAYWLQCFGYMVVGLLLGFWLRRAGIAIFIYLIYTLVVESILRHVIHLNLWTHKSVNFYPMNAFEDLVPIPVRQIGMTLEDRLQRDGISLLLHPHEAAVLSVIWILTFIGIFYWLLKQRDL